VGRPAAETNECFRSRKAYPARVAEAIYGTNEVTREGQVLKQQPPSFIFRACQGAITENLWAAAAPAGQWNELIEGTPSRWIVKPAQDLWLQLPGGEPPAMPIVPNNAITWVTLTAGGNDAGFATVGENCVVTDNALINLARRLNEDRCKEVITEWETGVAGMPNTLRPPLEQGIPSIKAKLELVLKSIHESAPNARIRVPLYPQIINMNRPGDLDLGVFALAPNVNVRFRIQRNVGLALERFVGKLNEKLTSTVEGWSETTGVDAEVIAGTATAFDEHQIGGPMAPWVNGLLLHGQNVNKETFHPNCLGHIALAKRVLKNMRVAVPAGWTCP
jgi:hypothetical protein